MDHYFQENVYPVLTPMAVDASRPFPLIRNKSLNIAALLSKKDEKKAETEFATVQVPSVLPRIIQIPSTADGMQTFLLLEQVIERNIHQLFLNYHVLCAYPYRIMRNADLSIDEDEAEDLLQEIQKQLKKRQWGEVIRLEVEEKIDKRLLKILEQDLHIALKARMNCAIRPISRSECRRSCQERISLQRSARGIFCCITLTRPSTRW